MSEAEDDDPFAPRKQSDFIGHDAAEAEFLAAYNAGRGAINRLVHRTGGDDFWQLARAGHLPGETKRFVPKVIALSLIVNNPDQYGFDGFKALG